MSVFQNALMFASLAYSILYDMRFLYLFCLFLGFNICVYLSIPKGNCNGTRRKVMCATWEEPREGCCYLKYEVDCTKVNEIIKK